MSSTHDDWTPGEARIWARRLSKVGFSPVSLHRDTSGWYLRCNWPYDYYHTCEYNLYESTVDLYVERGGVWSITSRTDARHLLATFRAVRLGMGSRPLPRAERTTGEPRFIPARRIVADADDWPPSAEPRATSLRDLLIALRGDVGKG